MNSEAIATLLQGLTGEYSFYYAKDGENPISFSNQDAEHQFLTASVIKVPILLAWIMLERQGKVAADEICDVGMEPVVEGSGFFYLFRQKKVTWHDILLMMIGTSDNYCTNLIISHVGMETLNHVFTEDLSLIDTHLGRKMMSQPDKASNRDNWMVAADLVRCFEVIEDFNQQERKFSEEMLLACQSDNLFQRNLPGDSIDFYHKSGGLHNVINEWGYTKDRRIFLFCNNFTDYLAVLNVFGTLGLELLL